MSRDQLVGRQGREEEERSLIIDLKRHARLAVALETSWSVDKAVYVDLGVFFVEPQVVEVLFLDLLHLFSNLGLEFRA